MFLSKKKKVAAATVAMLAIGGTAFAYWTTTGSGDGSATTAAGASAVVVNQTTTVTDLAPGAAVALTGTFDNGNDSGVKITTLTASVAVGTDVAGVLEPIVGCLASNYAITGTGVVANGGLVPVGAGVGSWSGLTVEMVETGANQDACKGADLQITYTAS